MISSSFIQPARVWLRRGALDRRLAEGADPEASPELALRARQLTSRRFRASLARSIYRLLDTADRPPAGVSSSIPVQRHDILADRGLLLGLAADLESSDELKPKGIALLERLITDGASPVYVSSADGTLHDLLGQARAALHLA
jgi:hypothetical protein